MKLSGVVAKTKGDKRPTRPGIQKKTYKKLDNFRAPAADEWKALQDGDTQSHYNFFRLQANEFLATLHRKQEHVQVAVDKWLTKFNTFISSSLKATEEKWDLTERMPWLRKVVVPFDMNTSGLKGTFKFVPPKTAANLIGSQTIGTSAPRENTVMIDVAVEMPKEFFQTADYLNFTYHCKKALYMSYVLEAGRKSKLFDLTTTKFQFLEDNPLQPVVVLPIDVADGSKMTINIVLHFCMEPGVYKLNRFIPARNNIRATTLDADMSEDDQVVLNVVPTYHYNNSILLDLVLIENHNLIVALMGKFPAVSDALLLLKYWLRRRKLDTIMPGYALNLLMCHLIKLKKVNPAAMTYYQIVRIFFSHFHLTDGMEKEVTLCDGSPGSENAPTFGDIRMFSDLCFLDATGFLNVFSRLHAHDIKRIIMESGKSLQMLDKSSTNAFQWLFLTEMPETIVFDHIFHVECTDKLSKRVLKSDVAHLKKILLFGVDTKEYISDSIVTFLSKGLGNRIHLLQCVGKSSNVWSVLKTAPSRKSSLMFGIILNPEFAFEVIVKGPQANDPAANEFREFWGELSQLRRFKDGSVTEACVFGASQDTPTEKRLVTAKIVEHLLTVHMSFIGGKRESLWRHHYFANQLTCARNPASVPSKKQSGILDMETQSLSVLREFNEVEMELRRLEGLPLDITGILGVAPIFYYSDPQRNLPNGYCSRDINSTEIIYGERVYDVVLTLSISGRWPDDLEAIQRLKAAFFMEIASRMQHLKGYFCRVAVDSIYILKGGYTFRFLLAHAKELQLMRQGTIDGAVAYRDTCESLSMERQLFVKPTLASALAGLHQQHNAFGPTVCLVKIWLNSLLLDRVQWPDECTELLVASLFMDDSKSVTAEVPVQPQSGFLRFLHLMAHKNWETELVLLNFNETMSQEKINQIQSSFTINRNQYPPVTIITSFDEKFGGIWAKEAPILQVLIRVIMLSKELLKRLTEKVECCEYFTNDSVFVTQFTGYDVVITLDVGNLKFLVPSIVQTSTRLPVDFDPVKIYLNELRVSLGIISPPFNLYIKCFVFLFAVCIRGSGFVLL